MATRQKTLLWIISAVIIVGSTSCKEQVSKKRALKPAPIPGAVNDGPNPKEVAYADLDYDKGIFTKDDVGFTGFAIQHHSNGNLKSRYQFVNGMFDGVIEEWWENGQRSTYKMYKENMRHGITTYWDEKGKPTKQVIYKDDEEIEEKIGDEIPKELGL